MHRGTVAVSLRQYRRVDDYAPHGSRGRQLYRSFRISNLQLVRTIAVGSWSGPVLYDSRSPMTPLARLQSTCICIGRRKSESRSVQRSLSSEFRLA